LSENREKLDLVAQKLLEVETLEAEEFVALLEGKDLSSPSSGQRTPPPTNPEANKQSPDWKSSSLDLPPAPSPA